jgi:SpoIID/LytB domain protein
LRIRQLLGNIPSSMFVIQAQRNAHRQISSWILHGGGWGHGVGMCQHGAIGRAQAGFSYHQILQHYFSEVALRRLY